jgi:hypothetical protein
MVDPRITQIIEKLKNANINQCHNLIEAGFG